MFEMLHKAGHQREKIPNYHETRLVLDFWLSESQFLRTHLGESHVTPDHQGPSAISKLHWNNKLPLVAWVIQHQNKLKTCGIKAEINAILTSIISSKTDHRLRRYDALKLGIYFAADIHRCHRNMLRDSSRLVVVWCNLGFSHLCLSWYKSPDEILETALSDD